MQSTSMQSYQGVETVIYLSSFLMLFGVLLGPLSAEAADYKIQILDAIVKDKAVQGATVILQKNGEQSLTSTTDAKGEVNFPTTFLDANASSTTMIVKKEGYSNLVVRCPCEGMTYAISPVIKNIESLRIVLSWGKNPKDLDSHLFFEDQHVYLASKSQKDAMLDVDDRDSFGPETITIHNKHAGAKYVYAVVDYTSRMPNSKDLSDTSDAKVFVYVGSTLVRTFQPPKNKTGTVWVVFGIGENGEFYDINEFLEISHSYKGWQLKDKFSPYLGRQLVSNPVTNDDSRNNADRYNREGEVAYHAKKLDKAVQLYQEAINLNPEHSQAYSNLGLAFMKLGRQAESIWANRKAIVLASGNNSKTVKASSYYNIARVYEEQSRFSDALAAFEEAKKYKSNAAYDKGIQRMKQALAKKP